MTSVTKKKSPCVETCDRASGPCMVSCPVSLVKIYRYSSLFCLSSLTRRQIPQPRSLDAAVHHRRTVPTPFAASFSCPTDTACSYEPPSQPGPGRRTPPPMSSVRFLLRQRRLPCHHADLPMPEPQPTPPLPLAPTSLHPPRSPALHSTRLRQAQPPSSIAPPRRPCTTRAVKLPPSPPEAQTQQPTPPPSPLLSFNPSASSLTLPPPGTPPTAPPSRFKPDP
ncbi:uncharacterized protein A4U43_C05F31810 [Asparagus officinalis]|uniref:Uncharacterized protein n=1 Tax=Asparagus officinalis TaxID=4686 RepID=A0A5P1F0J9_ASPOF|nr:uncharacterized protein A4U43_C05F31810 [Asparagus officinalis]